MSLWSQVAGLDIIILHEVHVLLPEEPGPRLYPLLGDCKLRAAGEGYFVGHGAQAQGSKKSVVGMDIDFLLSPLEDLIWRPGISTQPLQHTVNFLSALISEKPLCATPLRLSSHFLPRYSSQLGVNLLLRFHQSFQFMLTIYVCIA